MKILYISKYASPPKYSKVPARLFLLAREFVKLNHEVSIVTSDSNHLANFPKTKKVYNYEIIEQIKLCWIKTVKYKKTASLKRVLSWFDFEKKLFGLKIDKNSIPDVVIVSSLSLFSIIYGYYLKKKYNSFLVFEIRDIWPLTLVEEGGFSRWHPLVLLMGAIEKFGYKKSDLIVGTMPKLDLHVEKIIGITRPFFCSPLGFDSNSYKDTKEQKENIFKNNFPSRKVIVGYAGSIGITNSLESFIDTIKLMSENNNMHFVLVGDGDLKSKYKKELENYNNVTFLPRIAQNDVKFFLQNCDIMYLAVKDSKVWEYGQSMNKVVEYMLSAKPIIASYSGFPSMIDEAKCGIFISKSNPNEIKKAIMQFANMSCEEREQIGQRGREWIFENRKYSKLAREYIDKIIKLKTK